MKRAGLLALTLFLVTLVPMWFAVLGEISHERALTENSARKDAMNLATAFEAHARSVIELMDLILVDMREDVSDPGALEKHLINQHQTYKRFANHLTVLDAKGRVTFTNVGKLKNTIDLSDREHFLVHANNPGEDRLYISKPVLGRISKQWTIQFTRPVHKEGRFAGVVLLSVPTDFFADYLQQIDVGANGVIALLGADRSLRAIASGAPMPGRYGRFKVPVTKPYFDEKAPDHGYFEGVSAIDEEHRVGAYRRLKDFELVVVVLLSPTDFMAAFHGRRNLLMVSTGLISGFALALAILLFVLARRHFQNMSRLREAHKLMSQLANTDMLTGVKNRRAFLLSLETEVDRARRYGQPLSLIMLDIDHFKLVNDAYGHPIGDDVLKTFAKICKSVLRSHDVIGRLGGEEFAVVLPQTTATIAKCVAEKIRLAVGDVPIETAAGHITITVSLGLTQLQADDHQVGTLITRADRALYRAKRGGRNQVSIISELHAVN